MKSLKKNEKENSVSLYKYIHCDVWKRGVTIFIGEPDKLLKIAKKIYDLPEEKDMISSIEEYGNTARYKKESVAGSTYDSSSGQWIIHLPKFPFEYDPKEIANLSHELLHATHGILDFVGMEYRYGGNNEAYTYLHEYLLKEALNREGYKQVK